MTLRMTRLMRAMMLVLLGSVMLAPVGCTTNPATGKKSFTLYSWEEEKQMGAEAAAGLAAEFGGEVESAIPSDYVAEVGMKLVAGIEDGVPPLDWEFTLLNTSVINAFALPGGKVFFTRGLAEQLSDEAEMAGVLGHEIGHVTARHGNQRISKQIGFNVGLALGAVAVGVADDDTAVGRYGQVAIPGLAIGGNLVLLKYGRDDESEADMLGMRYMERAGYDPSGQLRVMEVLEAASSGARTVEWLATHPYPETRIERINKILAEQYPNAGDRSVYVINATEYQQKMLNPLSKLAPAADAQQSSLLLQHPALWCGQCRVAGVE